MKDNLNIIIYVPPDFKGNKQKTSTVVPGTFKSTSEFGGTLASSRTRGEFLPHGLCFLPKYDMFEATPTSWYMRNLAEIASAPREERVLYDIENRIRGGQGGGGGEEKSN